MKRIFKISAGRSRLDNRPVSLEEDWDGIIDRFRSPKVLKITAREYQDLLKDEKAKIKDTGYIVPGEYNPGSRKTADMISRSFASFDIDHADVFWEDELLVKLKGQAFLVHSTCSHTEDSPRLRLLRPFSRNVSPAEYQPIVRRLAEWIGIELFDHTGFRPGQIIYLPARPSDVKYELLLQDGQPIDPDEILATYEDWTDRSSWPKTSKELSAPRQSDGTKMEDPTKKSGPVGDFCRAYDIYDAIAVFDLPYDGDPETGRLTYEQGTSSNGAVVYDAGLFLYSHHESDPCFGRCVNSFDLVRLHRYHHLDADLPDNTPVTELPSYLAMLELVAQDAETDRTRVELAVEGFEVVEIERATALGVDGLAALLVDPADPSPIKRPEPIIDPIVPGGEVTLEGGHGGIGKSAAALAKAILVATGRSFGDMPTRRVKVLYYSAEDGREELRYRIAKICRVLGVDPAELHGWLYPVDASDIDPVLFIKNPMPRLKELATLAKLWDIGFTVIDNASDTFAGDEIKKTEVRAFVRAVRTALARPARGVLLLIHIPKSSAKANDKGFADEQDYGGSVAWHNSCRSRLALVEDKDGSLWLHHRKANYGPKAPPVKLTWVDGVPVAIGGFDGQSTELQEAAAELERIKTETDKAAILALISDFHLRGERVTTARQGPYSTYRLLSPCTGFPYRLPKDKFDNLLRGMESSREIIRTVVRTANRKDCEVFIPGAPISTGEGAEATPSPGVGAV